MILPISKLAKLRRTLTPRFSLRTLFAIVLIFAVSLGWRQDRRMRHYRAIDALKNRGVEFWDGWEDVIGPNFLWARDLRFLEHTPTNGFCKDIGLGEWFAKSPLCTTGYFGCWIDGPNFGTQELSMLPAIQHLEHLTIRNCSLSADDMANLTKLRELKYLTLDIKAISNDHLIHLRRLSGLETMYLSKIEASDRAISDLKRSLPHCEITVE